MCQPIELALSVVSTCYCRLHAIRSNCLDSRQSTLATTYSRVETTERRDPLVPSPRPIFFYFPSSVMLVSVNRCENVSHCLTPIPVHLLHPEDLHALFNVELSISQELIACLKCTIFSVQLSGRRNFFPSGNALLVLYMLLL